MIQRPWDGAFDEYLTYTYRDQAPARDHAASQLKYTDGGRKVYSGGGIEPDHFVPGSGRGVQSRRGSRACSSERGAFVTFAERFTRTATSGRPRRRRPRTAWRRGWQ